MHLDIRRHRWFERADLVIVLTSRDIGLERQRDRGFPLPFVHLHLPTSEFLLPVGQKCIIEFAR